MNVRLSKNKIKTSRVGFEVQFMEVPDEVFKQAGEISKKDQEIQKLKEKLEQAEKQQDWADDGNSKPKSTKKGNKKYGRFRNGSGSKCKMDIEPTEANITQLDYCPECGDDLQNKETVGLLSRTVTEITENQGLIISEEIVDRKWCPNCQKLVSSKSVRALPLSHYGLNTVVLFAYFWVETAISLPNISRYLNHFFNLIISTTGISNMMIRLGEILAPVYEEIQIDVKSGVCMWTDETDWNIKGKLYWMWAFANKDSAYYWIDQSRGGDVVNRLLGDIFAGVFTTGAWAAYATIVGDRQACMDIFKKIRKYIEINPSLKSPLRFYLKLHRILRDAEKLKDIRDDIDEFTHQRRLTKLKERLSVPIEMEKP